MKMSSFSRQGDSIRGPQGSLYDKAASSRRKRKGFKRIRKGINRVVTVVGCWMIPLIYRFWFRCVFLTSKVELDLGASYPKFNREKRSIVSLLWHQNIFPVAYLLREHRVTALAGTGTSGRLATAILEGCDFEVFRGGRKRSIVIRDMIEYMLNSDSIRYGIAVDGSKGPAKKMKPGGCLIARKCGAPIFLIHIEAKKEWHTPTWDQMAITLPFNELQAKVLGPYWVDPECSEEAFEQYTKHVENELLNLAIYMERSLEKDKKPRPKGLKANSRVPEYQWLEGELGRGYSRWDLQSEERPDWVK